MRPSTVTEPTIRGLRPPEAECGKVCQLPQAVCTLPAKPQDEQDHRHLSRVPDRCAIISAFFVRVSRVMVWFTSHFIFIFQRFGTLFLRPAALRHARSRLPIHIYISYVSVTFGKSNQARHLVRSHLTPTLANAFALCPTVVLLLLAAGWFQRYSKTKRLAVHHFTTSLQGAHPIPFSHVSRTALTHTTYHLGFQR